MLVVNLGSMLVPREGSGIDQVSTNSTDPWRTAEVNQPAAKRLRSELEDLGN